MAEPWVRSINMVGDHAERERTLRVVIDERHNIVVMTPPGDVARLHPRQIDEFKQALTEAQLESLHRHRGW